MFENNRKKTPKYNFWQCPTTTRPYDLQQQKCVKNKIQNGPNKDVDR